MPLSSTVDSFFWVCRWRTIASATPLSVWGLVFDVGGLEDKSFNDASFRGLVRARQELNVEFQTVEPGDGSDRESAIRQLAFQGFDPVIGVGFVFSDDLRKLSREFPKTNFVGIDFAVNPGETLPKNLLAVRFREEQGSFLVGAIAALKSKSKRVGFVGGMDIALIRKFAAGYRAGAMHVCPDCRVFEAYAGTEPKAFSDPVTGKELARVQFQKGADVIYHAAGRTGVGVIHAAVDTGNWAIGVDSDQFGDAPCCVLTSMVKKVDVAVFDAIQSVAAGKFSGGMRELGLAEDGVGYVYDDNNHERLAPSLVARVEQLRQEIIDKKFTVPIL